MDASTLLFWALVAVVVLVVVYAAGLCVGLGLGREENAAAYRRGWNEGRRCERREINAELGTRNLGV